MDEHSPEGPDPTTSRDSSWADSDAGSLGGLRGLLRRQRWLVFVLPFLVYMAVGTLEPKPPEEATAESATGEEAAVGEETEAGFLDIDYHYYPAVYTLKIILTLLAIAFVWPGYDEFPFRTGGLAIAVGAIGAVIWVGLCALELEQRLGQQFGLEWLIDLGKRSSFNPLEELKDVPAMAYAFLAVRFFGLVLIVPLIEEFFLRGFLMRFVMQAEWWKVPFSAADYKGLAVVTLAAMAMHPAELVAALAWFSLISWLMLKTGNIWDCVTAHAVTNLLMGIYVVTFDEWQLM